MLDLRRSIPSLSLVLALAACDGSKAPESTPAAAPSVDAAPTPRDAKPAKPAEGDGSKTVAAKPSEGKPSEAEPSEAKTAEAEPSEAEPTKVAVADPPVIEPTGEDPKPSPAAGTPAEIGPLWASGFDGALTMFIGAQGDDPEFDKLADLLLDNDGEIETLKTEQIPAQYRGLKTVTMVDTKGVSTAKIVRLGAVEGAEGVELVAVFDRPGRDRDDALVLMATPANPKAKLVTIGDLRVPRLQMKGVMASVGTTLAAQTYDEEYGFDVAKLRAKHIKAKSITAPEGQGVLVAVNMTVQKDEDWDMAVTALLMVDLAKGVQGTVIEPSISGAVYEPKYRVDLDGDGIDEVIVEEQWMEGGYTKIMRWDPGTKTYVVATMTGSAA